MIEIEISKAIISYLSVSLSLLILFNTNILDLEVADKYRKFKNLIIVVFCILWPAFIFIILNTIMNGGNRQ